MAKRKPKRVAAEEKQELVPLTQEHRATLTQCANLYGMEHAIASAAAVERFIRKPNVLEEFAAEKKIEIGQLSQLLEPFPDAATLKATNDKVVE